MDDQVGSSPTAVSRAGVSAVPLLVWKRVERLCDNRAVSWNFLVEVNAVIRNETHAPPLGLSEPFPRTKMASFVIVLFKAVPRCDVL